MILWVVTFVMTLLGGFVFPWWWPVLVGMVLGLGIRVPYFRWHLAPKEELRAFILSALGAGLAWGLVAAVQQGLNHGLLAAKVAVIFHMPNGWSLVFVTALVGGLSGGFGILLGRSCRRNFPGRP